MVEQAGIDKVSIDDVKTYGEEKTAGRNSGRIEDWEVPV